jgi:hypothetical protein
MSLSITKSIRVTFGTEVWTPKIKNVCVEDGSRVECVSLASCYGLIRVLLAMAAIPFTKKDLYTRPIPSLGCAPGYIALKKRRNQQQAAELDAPTPQDKPKKRKLFRDASSPKRVMQRKSRAQIEDLRQKPALFKVSLSDGDGGKTAVFQRPILSNDEMTIEADEESIENALQFIVDHGISYDAVKTKRAYRASFAERARGRGKGRGSGRGRGSSAAEAAAEDVIEDHLSADGSDVGGVEVDSVDVDDLPAAESEEAVD